MQVIALENTYCFPPNIHREEGLHLSDILNLVFPFEGEIDDETRKKFEMGFAWERAIEMGLAERHVERPKEIRCEGIWMSPDGIEYLYSPVNIDGENIEMSFIEKTAGKRKHIYLNNNRVLIADLKREHLIGKILHEYKLTWKSCNPDKFDIEKQERYLCQVKAYCYAIKANTAIIHWMFINGDYKWGKGDSTGFPYYKAFKLIFSEQEIMENWLMILNTAKANKLL